MNGWRCANGLQAKPSGHRKNPMPSGCAVALGGHGITINCRRGSDSAFSDLRAVAAIGFGLVQSTICQLHPCPQVVAVLRRCRQPDADRPGSSLGSAGKHSAATLARMRSAISWAALTGSSRVTANSSPQSPGAGCRGGRYPVRPVRCRAEDRRHQYDQGVVDVLEAVHIDQ